MRYSHVGSDVCISPSAEISRPQLVSVGDHSSIDSFVYITTMLEVGRYVHIAAHTVITGGAAARLTMKDFSFISFGGRIICATDDYLNGLIGCHPDLRPYKVMKSAPIVFEPFSGVGASTTVLAGVTLGEGSVVGAHSLVLESTEPWTVYAGSPAKPIKKRDRAKIMGLARGLGYGG